MTTSTSFLFSSLEHHIRLISKNLLLLGGRSMMSFSSCHSQIRALVLIAGACAAACLGAGSLHAEGFVSVGAGGLKQDASLVSSLGDAALAAEVTPASQVPVAAVAPRSASPREQTEAQVGSELFRNLRLAIPLVAESSVGSPIDAPMPAEFRPMSGPMVGVRPHPSIWGSSFAR